MCGHIFLINPGLQSLRQHQPLWRCSACGRQSRMPLDCCHNPAYHMPQTASLVGACLRRIGERIKLGDLLNGGRMRLRFWLKGHPNSGAVLDRAPCNRSGLSASSGRGASASEDGNPLSVSERVVIEALSVSERVSDVEEVSVYRDGLAELDECVHELQVH